MAFTTIAPQQSRPAGTFAPAAQAYPQGTNQVWVRAILSGADILDSTCAVTLIVEKSSDGRALNNPSKVWREDTRVTWAGGTWRTGRLATPPGFITVNPSATQAPFDIRVTGTLGRTTTIGVEVEVT
jgi:hypothetical protein